MKEDATNLPYYLRNYLQVNKQIFSALEYFEKRKLVHRDIKREFNFKTYA